MTSLSVSTPEAAGPAVVFRARRAALALAGLLLAVAVAPYLLPVYAVNILIRSFLYAAVALTVDLLWGYTGILTFGQSTFFGIGAYSLGLFSTHLGFSYSTAALALGAGVACAMATALMVGWLSFYYGASPLYASVVSLVLPIVVTQIIFSGGNFTGSSSGLSGFESFDLSVEAWFWMAGVFLAVLCAAGWVFVRSDFGRVLMALRDNDTRCAYLGINVTFVKTALLVATAAVAAVAGFIYAGYSMVVAPEMTGFVFGTELVIWVALGGRGTLVGPVLSAITIDLTSAYLSGELPFIWRLVIGLAFVVVIVAFPQGLGPIVARLWRRAAGAGAADRAFTPAVGAAAEPPPRPFRAGEGSAIDLTRLTKQFGSLRVLQGIDLVALHGELLSLVGPNGAGKTTLIRCLADGAERSGGTVRVNENDIRRDPPHVCVAYGIGRKFQTANVFDTLTVAESLRVARYRLERPVMWGQRAGLSLPKAALTVVTATGLAERLRTEVRYLPHGLKQALDLAMVLALEPSVLLLDEPTAGLTKPERRLIGQILTELAAKHRMCILLVEHDLDFVREISSRVVVLHQGTIVLDGTVDQVVNSQLVRSIYSGESQNGGHAT